MVQFTRTRSFLGPDRKLVSARIQELEPATSGKLERFGDNSPTGITNLGESRLEIAGEQDDQRTTRVVFGIQAQTSNFAPLALDAGIVGSIVVKFPSE